MHQTLAIRIEKKVRVESLFAELTSAEATDARTTPAMATTRSQRVKWRDDMRRFIGGFLTGWGLANRFGTAAGETLINLGRE
jgi:hypothetical protein